MDTGQPCPVDHPQGVLPTVLDDNQDESQDVQPNETMEPPTSACRPEGETMLPTPDLQGLDEPLQKRQKIDAPVQPPVGNQEIPKEFRVKWVKTSVGLVPFVRDEATSIVHCGKCQMQVFTVDGIATVICLRGCHWECKGHNKNHCGCHCHILQWHYNTR